MSKIRGTLTFGLELETPTFSPEARLLMGKYGCRKWHDATVLHDDGRKIICGDRTGGHELILPPLSVGVECSQDGQGLKFDYSAAEQVVREAVAAVPHVNQSCGVHIHLGRPTKDNPLKSVWEPERIRTWLAAGMILEPKIFNLVPPSRHQNNTCKKILECYTREDVSSYYPIGEVKSHKRQNPKRYCWLNLIETRRVGTRPEVGYSEGPATGTVEIRLLGNTARFEYVWAWTKFWLATSALVAYVPTSLAVLHAAALTTLEPYFDEVFTAKQNGKEL